LLNYPTYFPIRQVWNGINSFWGLKDIIDQEFSMFGEDRVEYMGLFVDNHDNPRFLNVNYNIPRF